MANASVDHGELINKLFQQGTTVPRTETLVMAAGVVRKTFEAELKYGPIKGKTPIDYTNFVKVVLSDKNKSYPPECVSTANRIIEATLSADLEKHAASSKQGISQQKKVPVAAKKDADSSAEEDEQESDQGSDSSDGNEGANAPISVYKINKYSCLNIIKSHLETLGWSKTTLEAKQAMLDYNANRPFANDVLIAARDWNKEQGHAKNKHWIHPDLHEDFLTFILRKFPKILDISKKKVSNEQPPTKASSAELDPQKDGPGSSPLVFLRTFLERHFGDDKDSLEHALASISDHRAVLYRAGKTFNRRYEIDSAVIRPDRQQAFVDWIRKNKDFSGVEELWLPLKRKRIVKEVEERPRKKRARPEKAASVHIEDSDSEDDQPPKETKKAKVVEHPAPPSNSKATKGATASDTAPPPSSFPKSLLLPHVPAPTISRPRASSVPLSTPTSSSKPLTTSPASRANTSTRFATLIPNLGLKSVSATPAPWRANSILATRSEKNGQGESAIPVGNMRFHDEGMEGEEDEHVDFYD